MNFDSSLLFYIFEYVKLFFSIDHAIETYYVSQICNKNRKQKKMENHHDYKNVLHINQVYDNIIIDHTLNST